MAEIQSANAPPKANSIKYMKDKLIPRDISWLSFNARVLQEANDPTVPLRERIRFLGIHSNNQDEFFRVRVATLKRMIEVIQKGAKAPMHLEQFADKILEDIHRIVLQQQSEFSRIWDSIVEELKKEKIYFLEEQDLNAEQKLFVEDYYDKVASPNIIPLMIESIVDMPYLRDKSLYLAVVMRKQKSAYDQKYALIEVPSKTVGRFIQLPSQTPGTQNIMLLEDLIRCNLPNIFSYFGYDHYSAHIVKVTKDAEMDIENDIDTTLASKIEKGLKKRRQGKPVRFVYDKEIDAGLLSYLIRRLKLTNKDNIIPGGRIHNFRHFMDFPDIFKSKSNRQPPFTHPSFATHKRVTDVILHQDILLNFPYHSFTSLIHLLREAAMDPDVTAIKLTAYRLASNSRIINALINAVRNGKKVLVVLELRARFDEEANLEWKDTLEQEGVEVITGVPNMKVHAKLCVITKKKGRKTLRYGFVSTGNLNESTAKIYGDHCLLTANKKVMDDIERVFQYIANPAAGLQPIRQCKTLLVCPTGMRKDIQSLINNEISNAANGNPAEIILKANALSDEILIHHLYIAAKSGVTIKLIIRGIFCGKFDKIKASETPYCISIVDEYLEHARVMVFHNAGKPKVFISSADWMVRNLDHRIEAAVPIFDEAIKKELLEILQIQLSDNMKARLLDSNLNNNYVGSGSKKRQKSQIETYNYLSQKANAALSLKA